MQPVPTTLRFQWGNEFWALRIFTYSTKSGSEGVGKTAGA